MSTTSPSLLARLRQPGDEQAWRRFVALYTPLLFYWAKMAGLRGDDAEDLIQDVFAQLVRKLPEFVYDPQQSFRGWLRTVVMRRSCDLARRARSTPVNNTADVPDPRAADTLQWLADSEYHSQLAGRALELMREEFEETTWRACLACTLHNRPAAEVARELGLTVNAVYVAKSRVLRRLRHELEGLWE